jgi:hypothetical protein
MAARFWVTGGTGNWNDTSNWSATTGGASGASVPGSADTATLDASSGSGTVTLDISPTIQTLTCTGFTGTLAFGTNTISLNSTGTIFTGATTMAVTGTPQIIATNASATARTINPGLVSEANAISFRITAGTGTVTFTSGNSNVLNLDFTDGTNPTGYAGALANINPTIYGNFQASTGMTKTAGSGAMTFGATSGVKTINTAGVTFDNPFAFNGVGGTFQLASALTSGAGRTATLTNGTLDLNGYTLTTGLFSSASSNTRTLAFGAGKVVITGTSATVYTTTTGTGMTMTGTRTVELTGVGVGGETRTISGAQTSAGGAAANAANFYIKAGADTISLGTANRVYGTLDFTGFSGSTLGNIAPQIYGDLVLSTGMTVAGGNNAWVFVATTSQTITTNGKTIDNPITFNGVGGTWAMQDALTQGSTRAFTITNGTVRLRAGATSTVGAFATSGTDQKFLQSTTSGTQATLSQSSGTVSSSYLTIQDINATGGAVWQAYTTNRNVNAGNNTGWDFIQQIGRYIYTRRKNKRILY